ncbi:MAG: hypothetical protein IPK77_11975 [Cellvibrio sp.]|nr:hypothetical protein [Cellvibrio sp.]
MTRKQKALEKLSYLWKLDDEDWVAQRKKDYTTLIGSAPLNDYPAREKKIIKFYFLQGKIDSYYPPDLLLFLTPYTNKDQAKEVFYSGIFDLSGMQRTMTQYLGTATEFVDVVPWVRDHIKNFVNGVLGDTYQEITWKFEGSGNINVISPEPGFWCRGYIRSCINLFVGGVKFHGHVECLDYFVSILKHSDKPNFRNTENLHKMLTSAESAKDNPSLSLEVQDFARKVCLRRQEIINAWNVNAHLDEVKLDG